MNHELSLIARETEAQGGKVIAQSRKEKNHSGWMS